MILPACLSKPSWSFTSIAVAACLMALLMAFGISTASGSEKPTASVSAVTEAKAPVPKAPMATDPKTEIPAEATESNWKSLERIDDKMANAIIVMTVFVTFLALLAGFYEFFKLREVEKLRGDFDKHMAEVARQHEKSMETKFVERFSSMFEAYKLDLNHRLLTYLNEKTSSLSQRHLRRSNVFHRVLLCYAYNELTENDTDALLSAHVAAFIEFQRALVQILSGQADDVATGLNYIRGIADNATLSDATATQLIPFLMLVKDDLVMQHFSVAQSWNELVYTLETKINIKRDDPILADSASKC